jgi:pyruvate dehydrogenase (quinone)
VVQGLVDPLEPPMPAKITLKQMSHLAESLPRGEPNRECIALTVLADKVRELI